MSFQLRFVTMRVFPVVLTLLAPAAASAQSGAIAGLVRDASGAVLPGVTVEAASPALIEKLRSATTDGQGQYKILDLRPGVYVVTFGLPGFKTVKREGIELSAGGTVNVAAELAVGALEETVTVAGLTPLIDVQNVTQHRVVTADVMAALPVGRAVMDYAQLIPGMKGFSNVGFGQDVGGSVGEQARHMSIHGSRGVEMPQLFDGMKYNNLRDEGGGSSLSWSLNTGVVQEVVVDVAGHSAEQLVSGPRINAIPKEGSNTFRGILFGTFTNKNLQASNITPELVARGVASLPSMDKLWEVNASTGGPIKQDRLWFFGSFRNTVNNLFKPGAFYDTNPLDTVYIPDTSRPAVEDVWIRWVDARATWQASARNKFAFYVDKQWQCRCHSGTSSAVAPEASGYLRFPAASLVQGTYNSPVTNKLLVEAGVTVGSSGWTFGPQPGTADDLLPLRELSTGVNFRSRTRTKDVYLNVNSRAKMSYVTGSHALQVGMQTQQGTGKSDRFGPDISRGDLLRGVPTQVQVETTPYSFQNNLNMELGIFAQDQWTFKRSTFNLGLRFDYMNSSVPALSLPAAQFIGPRNFAAIDNVPNWKDLSPRFGVSHDLFGNGKTALKASFNKYLQSNVTGIANQVNPMNATVNLTTRPWADANGDFIPQLSELGLVANPAFGQTIITRSYDPDYLTGWGKRGENFEAQLGLQHELRSGLSVNAEYTRHWYGKFLATDNIGRLPSDYSPFCVTVPVDSRFPGGGGSNICGYYDVNPDKRTSVQEVVTAADNFGEVTDVYNGLDLSVNMRLPGGVTVQGGTSTGREITDNCDVAGKVDNPVGNLQANTSNSVSPTGSIGRGTNPSGLASPSTLFCHIEPPIQTQLKLLAVVPLRWWGISTSATFQVVPGSEIYATYSATNAQVAPSLGRPLSGGAAVTTVQLLGPGQLYGDTLKQLDFRVTKAFRIGRGRVQALFDIFNVLNASTVLAMNNTYGPAWQTPTTIMPGRFIKFGMQADF